MSSRRHPARATYPSPRLRITKTMTITMTTATASSVKASAKPSLDGVSSHSGTPGAHDARSNRPYIRIFNRVLRWNADNYAVSGVGGIRAPAIHARPLKLWDFGGGCKGVEIHPEL